MRLEARTVLVTGGASGIGAGAARRPAAEGAHVAIGDLDLDRGHAAAVAFLASDDAAYATGQTLNVSGGLSVW
jgi:NAD(P)-dependent dehydrogenase (short-subunit alcohol dehydrogenase family)